ncbi:hypothetical protein RUM43_000532 [Polyplax serrata]|uniref:Uncharacterized protein n=1 Tax=Polyplax serrata TaxID=468196 RepID=A0AAN8SCM9_POLSC
MAAKDITTFYITELFRGLIRLRSSAVEFAGRLRNTNEHSPMSGRKKNKKKCKKIELSSSHFDLWQQFSPAKKLIARYLQNSRRTCSPLQDVV